MKCLNTEPHFKMCQTNYFGSKCRKSKEYKGRAVSFCGAPMKVKGNFGPLDYVDVASILNYTLAECEKDGHAGGRYKVSVTNTIELH